VDSNLENELQQILGHLKAYLVAHRDMGLDPPPGSRKPAGFPERKSHGIPPMTNGLDALEKHLDGCRRCQLHKGRSHLVFGEGSPQARLLFVGEGPGYDEDRVGKPFVGEAGKLLNRIIENGMGLTREEVYICNVVKCHPPGNRDPEPDEIKTCLPFLEQQIQLIQPEVICTLGRIAGVSLLGKDFKITRDRGRWHTYRGIALMPTFHPAYLLRYPSKKRLVWEDVKRIMARLGMAVKRGN
jgi:DNA polymerase